MKKTNKILMVLGCAALGLGGIGVAKAVSTAPVQANATATTVTKTIATLATANKWVNGTAYTSWALDGNVTISTTGTGNNGKYYSSGSGTWRLYQVGTGNLIITVAAGYTLTSVKATYSVSNTGTLTGLESGIVLTVSGSSVTYTVGNTGTAINGIVQISEISVSYDVSTNPAIAINVPSGELSVGTTGTFTATTANVTSPTITWTSSDACITVTSTTGAYIVNSYGSSTITASMVVSGTTYSDSIVVNANGDVTIAQANTIGGGLASGVSTTYTVNVSGTISAVATSSVTISDGTNTLLIYGTYSPNNAASKGWGVGGIISFKGNIQNYNGTTVEMTSPSARSYTGNALALSNFIMMASTANQCTTQFAIAKAQYFAMSSSEQALFNTAQTGEATVITNARARYEAWAVNQAAEPYTGNATPAINVAKEEAPSYIMYGIGGLALVAALGSFFYFRKKKQA